MLLKFFLVKMVLVIIIIFLVKYKHSIPHNITIHNCTYEPCNFKAKSYFNLIIPFKTLKNFTYATSQLTGNGYRILINENSCCDNCGLKCPLQEYVNYNYIVNKYIPWYIPRIVFFIFF